MSESDAHADFYQPGWHVAGDVYNVRGQFLLAEVGHVSGLAEALADLRAGYQLIPGLDNDKKGEIETNLGHDQGSRRSEPERLRDSGETRRHADRAGSCRETDETVALALGETVAKLVTWAAHFSLHMCSSAKDASPWIGKLSLGLSALHGRVQSAGIGSIVILLQMTSARAIPLEQAELLVSYLSTIVEEVEGGTQPEQAIAGAHARAVAGTRAQPNWNAGTVEPSSEDSPVLLGQADVPTDAEDLAVLPGNCGCCSIRRVA